MNLIKDFILKLWIWRIFRIHKNKLPSEFSIENPKMKYAMSSDAFIWDDEGLWEARHHFANAFSYVIHHRMKLIVGPDNDVGVLRSADFDRQIFNMAKKYFPDWIGFDPQRCSYNPELADRIMRIRKVVDYQIQKFINEE